MAGWVSASVRNRRLSQWEIGISSRGGGRQNARLVNRADKYYEFKLASDVAAK